MRRLLRAIPIAALVLSSSFAFAQTTGEIIGRVADEQGGGLPGVTVEARSAALQGVRAAISDATGTFRLVQLPPGAYKVTAVLAGFTRGEQTVTVALAKSSNVDHAPAPGRAGRDHRDEPRRRTSTRRRRRSAATSTTAQIRSLPTGRNYSAVVLVAPGVTTQASNSNTFAGTIAIYGSSGLENSYHPRRRRHDRRRVRLAGQGPELRVHPGGRGQGRRLPGGVRPRDRRHRQRHHEVRRQRVPRRRLRLLQRRRYQAANKHPDENLYGTNQGFSRYDGGIDVGGYAWKDRIWFFGAYDRVQGKVTNQLTSGPAGRRARQQPDRPQPRAPAS